MISIMNIICNFARKMERRVLPTLNLQADNHELYPSNYCTIRQIPFTMAKIGYIMAISQYDKLEEDRL